MEERHTQGHAQAAEDKTAKHAFKADMPKQTQEQHIHEAPRHGCHSATEHASQAHTDIAAPKPAIKALHGTTEEHHTQNRQHAVENKTAKIVPSAKTRKLTHEQHVHKTLQCGYHTVTGQAAKLHTDAAAPKTVTDANRDAAENQCTHVHIPAGPAKPAGAARNACRPGELSKRSARHTTGHKHPAAVKHAAHGSTSNAE